MKTSSERQWAARVLDAPEATMAAANVTTAGEDVR
jgi:hypothetical protein